MTAIFATEVCKRYGRRPILLIGNALVAIILGSLGNLLNYNKNIYLFLNRYTFTYYKRRFG